MAHYRASLDTPLPREEAFAYLSDFSTTEEWDPGVVQARRRDAEGLGEGSEFRLLTRFLGRTVGITYTVIEYEPPGAVTFHGENATVTSRDRITFLNTGEGTRIVYDAELTLRGPLRLADPLLRPAFERVGDRALAGLRQTLARRVAARGAAVEA